MDKNRFQQAQSLAEQGNKIQSKIVKVDQCLRNPDKLHVRIMGPAKGRSEVTIIDLDDVDVTELLNKHRAKLEEEFIRIDKEFLAL